MGTPMIVILAEAAGSDGRLVPFCRLDPNDGAVAEGSRCIELGARGIKLHPRSDEFLMDAPEAQGDLRAGRRASTSRF